MMVTPDMLDQTKIQVGDGYVVAPIKTNIPGLTRTTELCGLFDGLNSLFNYQQKFQAKAQRGGSSDRYDRDFHFFKNYKTATDTYLNNPHSIVDFEQNDTYVEGGESSGKQLVYDVTGDILDVSRFLEGEPECFGSLTNGNPRNKRVNLYIGLSWGGGQDKAVINERGKRIIRLVDWLESQGVRTKVVGIVSNSCYHVEVTIKHFDEALDINDIAIVGHSDFLRRVMFRFCEYSATYDLGYGTTRMLSDYMQQPERYQSEYNDEYSVYINGLIQTNADIVYGFDQLETDLSNKLSGEDTSDVTTWRIL